MFYIWIISWSFWLYLFFFGFLFDDLSNFASYNVFCQLITNLISMCRWTFCFLTTFFLSLSLSLLHTHTHTPAPPQTRPHPYTHIYTQTYTHMNTHPLLHSLSLSFSRYGSICWQRNIKLVSEGYRKRERGSFRQTPKLFGLKYYWYILLNFYLFRPLR